jgi:hypothetical protein
MVTNARLFHARMGFLGLLVLREVSLATVARAQLRRVRPTAYWIAGALLIGSFSLYAWTAWHDPEPSFDWRALALLAFGVLAFSAGTNRWKLILETSSGIFHIVQPGTSREYARAQMAGALREAARVAGEPLERARWTEEVRAAADPDAD